MDILLFLLSANEYKGQRRQEIVDGMQRLMADCRGGTEMIQAARFSDNDKRRPYRNTADKLGLNDAITFKGGISLSKSFHLISCFSEGIDLSLDWRILGYGKEEPLGETFQHEAGRFNKKANMRAEFFLAQTLPTAAGVMQTDRRDEILTL